MDETMIEAGDEIEAQLQRAGIIDRGDPDAASCLAVERRRRPATRVETRPKRLKGRRARLGLAGRSGVGARRHGRDEPAGRLVVGRLQLVHHAAGAVDEPDRRAAAAGRIDGKRENSGFEQRFGRRRDAQRPSPKPSQRACVSA